MTHWRCSGVSGMATSVSGDYLIQFDLRAENEKDLSELAATMQTLRFPEP